MAKIHETKTGYKTQAYIGTLPNGHRVYKWLHAPTKAELNLIVAYEKVEFEKNNALSHPEIITLEEACKRYIKSKTAILSPSTLRMYEKADKLYFSDIRKIPLSNITQELVQTSINKLAKNKKAPKTVYNAHGFLSAVLKEYAPNLILNTKLPQKEKKEIQVPTHEQVKSLIDKSKDTYLEPVVLLAAYAGLRRSELCALNQEDFSPPNTPNPTVYVNKALVRNSNHEWVLKTTKTYSSTRTVPIPKAIFNRLLETLPSDGQIITHTPDSITRSFSDLVKSLNLKMRLHDLRHYYASVMLSLNIPDKYAISLMGHSTDNMLKAVYQHQMADKRAEVINDLTSFFDKEYNEKNVGD